MWLITRHSISLSIVLALLILLSHSPVTAGPSTSSPEQGLTTHISNLQTLVTRLLVTQDPILDWSSVWDYSNYDWTWKFGVPFRDHASISKVTVAFIGLVCGSRVCVFFITHTETHFLGL